MHRDLKPANVMVGRFGETYVMDWGLAKVRGRRGAASSGADAAETALLTGHGTVIGTPAYMPPEQAAADAEAVGPRSDVYAVGAMLYELLAGRAPYLEAGEDIPSREVLHRVRSGPPPPVSASNPRIPAELVAICERAMARDPAGRYAGIEELGEDLRAYLELRVVRAYRTGPLAELAKWLRRNRGLAGGAAAAVLALAVGLAVSLGLYVRSERQRVKVMELADVKRLRDLELESRTLCPAWPENRLAYGAWLREADRLLERLDSVHRPNLAEMEDAGELSTEERWQRETLAGLVADLTEFADPAWGLRADVVRRLAWSLQVEERTRSGPAAAAAWSEAVASIADVATCPEYGGLTVTPQLGLLPIGRDSRSGLWEFAHPRSGTVPERDPATGRLQMDEESALVFVLIPGGTFWMGGQRMDPDSRNFDPHAQMDELPVEAVSLAPFFLSKFEMSQGQWMRCSPERSRRMTAAHDSRGELVIDLLYPVSNVTWQECDALTRNLGLQLPTEAQWEYAARARDSSTPWWTGAERESLVGAVNLADQAAARSGAVWSEIADWPELDDGYGLAAPVDRLRPNPFGLHHVLGNVWEWCTDPSALYDEVAPRAGDGLRWPREDPAVRIARGGGYYDTAAMARSAARSYQKVRTEFNDIGVRPARPLQ